MSTAGNIIEDHCPDQLGQLSQLAQVSELQPPIGTPPTPPPPLSSLSNGFFFEADTQPLSSYIPDDENACVDITGLPDRCDYPMLFGALRGTGKIYHCEIYRDILWQIVPPPSEHSRVLMITGPSNIVSEAVLRGLFHSVSDDCECVQTRHWDDGIVSIVWSFASYFCQAEFAFAKLLQMMEAGFRGHDYAVGWEKVRLTWMADSCEAC
ncbi:hypothetical protein F5B17DRAFT_428188 [Nemania serpens]|nr:hypothetical protein F5B17DRAFT_428188 [Nemania serpens]